MHDVAWDGQPVILAGEDRKPRSGDLVVAMVKGRGCLLKRLMIRRVSGSVIYAFLSVSALERIEPILAPAADVSAMRVVVGVVYE